MKKAITLSLLLVALSLNLKAQATNATKNVGIGTLNPHPTAILDLDVSGGDFANKLGFLVPRMTVAQRDDIQNPATGLLVFVTDGVSGFYYYTGTEWKSMNSSGVDFGDKVENAIMYYGAGNVIQSNAKLMYNATDNAVSLTGTSINLKPATDGAAQDIKFFEDEANGDNSVSVKAAAALENDVIFELPKNNPAEGQVLKRTANGTEWVASSAPEFAEGIENAILYYTGTNSVGGTTNLIYKADENAVSLTGTSINLKPATDGAAQDIKFFEDEANGTNSVSVKAPAILGEDITFELPNNAPEEGQVLTRTAEGTMWATAGVPIGSVIPFAGSQAPEGWLIANGDEISREAYAALYAIIGDAYGAGDGTTTFNLPNLSGAFPRGLDAEAGSVVGQTGDGNVTLVADNIPAHQHTLYARSAANINNQSIGRSYYFAKIDTPDGEEPTLFSRKGNPGILDEEGLFGTLLYADDQKLPFHSSTIGGPEGAVQPVKTLPPYVKVLYIIRAK